MSIAVTRINTTPVKGVGLQHPSSVVLGPSGVHGNRRFYLIDDSGALINGKRAGTLVQLRADHDDADNRLTLILPDGEHVSGRVALTNKQVVTNFYGRDVRGTLVRDTWNEAISTLAGMPLRLVWADPATIAVDVHPVTLISTATMAWVRHATAGPKNLWANRFRMLFEIDGLQPFDEETWLDQRINIGQAVCRVIEPVPRCVITTQDPATGQTDVKTKQALRDNRLSLPQQGHAFADPRQESGRLMLGMYAVVKQPGTIRVGDTVAPDATSRVQSAND